MRISQAESVVMEALWRVSPQTAEDVAAEVGPGQGWGEATVRTLLARLVKKGAVSTEKDSRRFLYRPLIAREDYLAHESETLLERLFEGRLSPFLVQFADRRKLSAEDVAELKKLIADFEDDR